METLGEKIRRLYQEKGMKQKELAQKAGIDKSTMNKIVNDKCDVSVTRLKWIADALGIELITLYSEEKMESISSHNTGGIIYKICLERGISCVELADMSQLPVSTIYNVINSKYIPRNLTLEKIAKALNIDVLDLYPKSDFDEVVNETIGGIVRKLRIKNRMTRMELAEKANIDKGTIRNIENNLHVPRLSTVKLLAKALDVSVETIYISQ